MFRIRKIFDNTSTANREAIRQVQKILLRQFPLARSDDLERIVNQLHDPVQYRYRSILFVAEDIVGKVRGFAMLLHITDLKVGYLEFISAAPGGTGGGIGGVLYARVQEEARNLGLKGLFFDCNVDDPALISNKKLLKQNQSRMRFYERLGAVPIVNPAYSQPSAPDDHDLYYFMYDALGHEKPLRRALLRDVVRAVMERKYGHLYDARNSEKIALSFRDDPVRMRAPKYGKSRPLSVTGGGAVHAGEIALIVNRGHDIHHVQDRGYVEAPVRISAILDELDKTSLFTEVTARVFPNKWLKAVHAAEYVDYLHKVCRMLPENKSIYPQIFPLRNMRRPPRDIEMRVGYYCMDTFTPLNHNAYIAARSAVNCALTGAHYLLDEYELAYALVRPPGHHAETRAFGGFCYFNSAAVAAHYLSQYGRVAVLDIDFHHGNGTQEIFYQRSDVLTLSIHGHPHIAYPHFSGFADERGEADGLGYNLNYPLPEHTDAPRYHRTLKQALRAIRQFRADYLLVSLGLDTAKADPTGSWMFGSDEFEANGRLIGELGLPTLVVQEGGYFTQTLGVNARAFFEGLWRGQVSRQKPLS